MQNPITSTSARVDLTRLSRRSPSSVRGLCRPGVSTRISCASGRCTMPRITRRVVCGRSLVIATLAPTSAFVSVDLPTLGRPARQANPDRNTEADGESFTWLFSRLTGGRRACLVRYIRSYAPLPAYRPPARGRSGRPGPAVQRGGRGLVHAGRRGAPRGEPGGRRGQGTGRGDRACPGRGRHRAAGR